MMIVNYLGCMMIIMKYYDHQEGQAHPYSIHIIMTIIKITIIIIVVFKPGRSGPAEPKVKRRRSAS